MRIAINAADLDHQRIDGTRIYIQNMLKNFGLLDQEDQFLIYHKGEFNPELTFPIFENYKILKKPFPFWWTQTRFACEICENKAGCSLDADALFAILAIRKNKNSRHDS